MCPEAEPSASQPPASEARMVHGRPGQPPSMEISLALRTDRPRAEDPGRSGRSELSGSGPAHPAAKGCGRDALHPQLGQMRKF